MINLEEAAPVTLVRKRKGSWNTRIGVITVLTATTAIIVSVLIAMNTNRSNFHPLPPSAHTPYPSGTVDLTDPSGVAPPGANALPGYRLTYVTDFEGTTLPSGWNVFTGIPAGDPGGQFASTHVVVHDGTLALNTWKDPKYSNRWITGGLCQCGVAKTYGAYFVRSRITGSGPNEAELLWPANNVWPPEIDFNETGGVVYATSSTIHWGPINQIEQRHLNINMEQWHTWGVIWTPALVTYVVDGQVWGTITNASEIAKVPMTLDFEQRQLCAIGRQCPTRPVSMLIDWVAEYTAK
jgi:Glycosyl hydrolases family 16